MKMELDYSQEMHREQQEAMVTICNKRNPEKT